MSETRADILAFPSSAKAKHMSQCPGFTKALIAVNILMEHRAHHAVLILDQWYNDKLISYEEWAQLKQFWGLLS